MRIGFSLHRSIFCSLTLAAVGCGGGGSNQQSPGGGMPTMKMVGPSGGAVSSSDGNLAVNIPAGALPADVTITTEPAAAPATGAVGTVYEIGPTGTQFAMPVTLTLHYDMTALGGATESSLRVATFAGGSWQLLPGAVVDTQAKTVSGVTTHLSPYAIVTEMVGKTCATVQPGFGCAPNAGAGPSSGGASSDGTTPPNTGTGATGGGSSTCDPPTCAGATNVCGQYPGAAMDSCVDSPKGYSATCCFAPSAPICFAIAGAGGPCAGSTGGGGSSCPPPPTCESATAAMACAGYPGATLQNCTNGATGFTGACCFAPQAPVCVKTGVGRACAVSPSGGTSCSTPPPRCADGNPCANFIGAKASSCTDTADGFEATCCFAEGTLPIASGGGTGTGPSGGVDGGVPAMDAGTGGGTGGTGGTIDKPDGGGAGATTGAGGAGAGTGAGGMTGGGTCVPGAACTAGYRCGGASPNGACMDCMCGADGTLMCMSCDKPDGGGAGATTGAGGAGATTGAGGAGAGTGAGGMTGGGACAPGDACTQGYKCDPGSPAGACNVCMCGADGLLMCGPCGGAGASTGAGATTGAGGAGAGTGAGGMTGGGTCAPGDACTQGYKCDPGSPAGTCNVCMCGADGHLTCGPCGGAGATTGAGGAGAGTGAGGTNGGGTCAPGDACTPGYKCDPGSPAGSCNVCMCGADGHLTCGPCGGAGGMTGGGSGGTGGPVSGPCQVGWMPAPDVGLPCSVMEVCPDGTDYRVRCDGTSGACTCFMKGVPTATMPTLSCTGLVPSVALVACGFPDGKI